MIHLTFENIEDLKEMHYQGVLSYVRDIASKDARTAVYDAVMQLPDFAGFPETFSDEAGYDWLRMFILADLDMLKRWTRDHAELLKFDFFKNVYLNRFSNGADNYVDEARTYNAYTLFDAMDVHICPYCDDEVMVELEAYGRRKRTMEFDHFFPKGHEEYPGLAMCFYNLVPSCKPCNQVKKTNPTEANPYDPEIESLTWLYPDLEIGVNMETVTEDQCGILLHAKGGMAVNDASLGLTQRYSHYKSEVYQLLSKKQEFNIDKLEELERQGFGTVDHLKRVLFGNPRSEANGKEQRTKMKWDLIGY